MEILLGLNQDLIYLLIFAAMLVSIGWMAFPLIFPLLKKLPDAGFGISIPAGILLAAWLVWFLSSLELINFSLVIAILGVAVLFLLGIVTAYRQRQELKSWLTNHKKVWISETILFITAFLFWGLVRGFQPDIQGLEKFMDIGFVNSVTRSNFMPPPDPWLAGKTINYYYFGHFLAGFLTMLSGIDSAYSYNLMLAGVFSLGVTGGFSFIYNFTGGKKAGVVSGLLGTIMLNLGGNGHTLWQLLSSPNKSYWYPDATRFIPFTIHEFPAYSHVVADLHGHLINFPFVLAFLTILIGYIQSLKVRPSINWYIKYLISLGFLLGVFIMTNAWDFPIYGLILAIVVIYCSRQVANGSLLQWFRQVLFIGVITVLVAIVVSLPFIFNFKNITQGVALVETRSPLWQLAVLWGGFVIIGVMSVWRFSHKRSNLLWLLPVAMVGVSTLLIAIPEFIYVKDIYIKDYHRANTMFKLTYQSFVMMSLVFGVTVGSLIKQTQNSKLKTQNWPIFGSLIVLSIVFSAHMMYPFYAINSYYNGLKSYQGLYGLKWLWRQYPDDYAALMWLKNLDDKNNFSILEAVGESYTDFARMSAFSGFPTVLGWRVHEWLWRGGFNIPAQRTEEVRKMYESPFDPESIRLLKQYRVRYIIIGNLERKTYKIPNNIDGLGKIVFQSGNTKVVETRL
ncbi:hypothetical protein HZB78_00120 [Candidatus Collierbacteria bacterium]|nr:hypothetical protein [Candidatus Collierbacteria bacterium]